MAAEADSVTLTSQDRIDEHDGSAQQQPAAKRRRLSDWAGPSHLCGGHVLVDDLPSELRSRVADFLTPNEVACTLRLVSSAWASQFRGHVNVRLSQPVPHHAFRHRFGSWAAVRSLSLAKRQKLLALTAVSGNVENLRVIAGGPGVVAAVGSAGCALTPEVLTAAAAAGQLGACKELVNLGCPWEPTAVEAAARRGDRRLMLALSRSGCGWDAPWAVAAAAAGGHEGLVRELLTLAETTDHNKFQPKWRDWEEEEEQEEEEEEDEEEEDWDEEEVEQQQEGEEEEEGQEEQQEEEQEVGAARDSGARAHGGAAAPPEPAFDPEVDPVAMAAGVGAAEFAVLPKIPGIREREVEVICLSAAFGLRLRGMAELVVRSTALNSASHNRIVAVVAAALLSDTPDWCAKAEWLHARWLEGQNEARMRLPKLEWPDVEEVRVGLPTGHWMPVPLLSAATLLERMTWARSKGYQVRLPPADWLPLEDADGMHALWSWAAGEPTAAAAAAAAVAAAATTARAAPKWLQEASTKLLQAVAAGGHLATLQALATHAAGGQQPQTAAGATAAGGSEGARPPGATPGAYGSDSDAAAARSSGAPAEAAAGATTAAATAPNDLQGPPAAAPPPPVWVEGAARAAAEHGQVCVLRWLVATYGAAACLRESLWTAAAKGGLPVLQALHGLGCPGALSPSLLEAAVRASSEGNGLQLFEWFVQHGCTVPVGSGRFAMAKAAVESGSVGLLGRLHQERRRGLWSHRWSDVWEPAVRLGHVEVAEWLRLQGCPYPQRSLNDMEEELGRDGGTQPTCELYGIAIANGDLGMLQTLWLAENSDSMYWYCRRREKHNAFCYALRRAACVALVPSLPLISFVVWATADKANEGSDRDAGLWSAWEGLEGALSEGWMERQRLRGISWGLFDLWSLELQALLKERRGLVSARSGMAMESSFDFLIDNERDRASFRKSLAAAEGSIQAAVEVLEAQLSRLTSAVARWGGEVAPAQGGGGDEGDEQDEGYEGGEGDEQDEGDKGDEEDEEDEEGDDD